MNKSASSVLFCSLIIELQDQFIKKRMKTEYLIKVKGFLQNEVSRAFTALLGILGV